MTRTTQILSAFLGATLFTFAGLATLAQDASADNRGCDGKAAYLTCTSWGSCCDVHDACYLMQGCTAASWDDSYYMYDPDFGSYLGTDDDYKDYSHYQACKGCNSDAVSCMAGASSDFGHVLRPGMAPLQGPGPSQCCDAGTCGIPQQESFVNWGDGQTDGGSGDYYDALDYARDLDPGAQGSFEFFAWANSHITPQHYGLTGVEECPPPPIGCEY